MGVLDGYVVEYLLVGGVAAVEERYRGGMAARPVMTGEEWVERMRRARPPTPDDVPITRDGRRLDSPEAVRAWLADLAARGEAAGEHADA
jgi:hypothetical protein